MIEIGHVTKIEALRMRFDFLRPFGPVVKTVLAEEIETGSTGMQNPFGFNEEEDIPQETEE
jgi:hypothetical protein